MIWFKCYPADAISGVMPLTLEERGVYFTILMLLYDNDGELPSEDKFFATYLGCRPQMWRRIRDQLVAKGKLHYKTGGKLTANRVEKELETARKLAIEMSVLGRVSAEKRKQNKEDAATGRAPILDTRSQKLDSREERESAQSAPPAKRSRSTKTLLPEDWSPDWKTPPSSEDLVETEKMKDWARANAIRKADWSATHRNWLRRAAEFKRERPDNEKHSAVAAAKRLVERLGGEEAARAYVPGSSGPQPLDLDRLGLPRNLRLISSG